MLILGITGGVGSGKSKILYDLSNLYGAYIVETDKLAHTLMEPGQTVYQAVVEAFGTEILQAEEPYAIDRAKFAQIVFADKEKLAQLNALTHPAVKAWIRKDIEEKRKQDIVGDEFGKDGSRQGLLRAALAAVYAAVDLLAQFDVSVEHPAFIGGRCAVVVALFLARSSPI